MLSMMATIVVQPSLLQSESRQMLTDEQIEQLLQEAENNLRRKAGLEVTKSSDPQKRVAIPKLQHGLERSSYIKEKNGVAQANPSLLVSKDQKKMAEELRAVENKEKSKAANDQTDAGSQWFNLPKTVITPQLKRDLQIIELRSVLDPHRHYKKNTRKGRIPTFSQTGIVVEGPTEFYSSRINRKDRSKNFVDEAMKTEAQTGRFKRKYSEIQDAKTSGKKAHYKKLLQKRQKKS